MKKMRVGQRWISEMEPELGLGIVTFLDNRFVGIQFPASDCELKYAISSAPLKRVEFKEGDSIQSRQGETFIVLSTTIEDGTIVYHGQDIDLPESELNDSISFTTPQDRLMNGFIDNLKNFNTRYHSLLFQHRIRKSSIRGFIGGRISLIDHQLYVAHEIASRHIPRVLLSDETGLGKTIEVCLVLHRLLINGRINRALILVPHSLVHQWFVELLRRFNLVFRIFDSDYCESVTESDPGANPFLDDQLGLCSIDFLTSHEKWRTRAIAAGWDMLVIDEAHHLTEESHAYKLAKELSAVSTGLMLLTATPEQLGHQSHFARLQLLDPARYYDFDLFEQEAEQYQNLTSLVNKLLEGDTLDKKEAEKLAGLSSARPGEIGKKSKKSKGNNGNAQDPFIKDLLDRYGTGRAIFRNTRSGMSGFPERCALLMPLEGQEDDLKQQTIEFKADLGDNKQESNYNYLQDPRILWLSQFLKKNKKIKVLLICRSIKKVLAIEDALRKKIKVHIALFHEQLSLLQRDRNAAWFANDKGAQILICSEIGSEGRNFQFAHHLVLFDIPLNPELLEQRIGRLDRIGQKETIHIHIPYLIGSEYELLARWYHFGLNAFEKNVSGVYQIYQQLGTQVKECVLSRNSVLMENIIKKTQQLCIETGHKLNEGRDRLLELNSFQPRIAEDLKQQISAVDDERILEKFMLEVFHIYGIRTDYVSEQTYKVNLLLLVSPEFPLPPLKQEEFIVTFDRETAIKHEDIEFLSWDHPMVTGVLEFILGSEKGNCTAAIWSDSEKQEILLEAVYLLECVAPKSLYVDRFLPPTPIRVVVNHSMQNCSEIYSDELFARCLKTDYKISLLENPQVKKELFPEMLRTCNELAEKEKPDLVKSGLSDMETRLIGEVSRLQELQKVNKNIREEEIQSCKDEIMVLGKTINSARLRLDSLRFITRGDV